VTEEDAQHLRCENAYLKDRCGQLEAIVADLTAQVARMQEGLVRPGLPQRRWHGNWLSTGQ
jgi:hypothetical protein